MYSREANARSSNRLDSAGHCVGCVLAISSSTDLLHHVLLLHLTLSELLEQHQTSLLQTQLLSQSFDHLLPLFSGLPLDTHNHGIQIQTR